ncbi:MAG TPA: phosphatase PAP2 family protein [Nocardioides sp.]|nr:phosphatase PAP2 family protein [Nocardioides sp.]
MYRRAYVLLVGTASVMGALAVITAIVLDKRLADPEGFLGPSWLRLPLLLFGAFLLDLLPRTLWHSRLDPRRMPGLVRERVHHHWTRERLTLVVMGLVCFYITYVSYRNLKSFLPFVMGQEKYDRELHIVDTALFLGHDPSTVLQSLLGTDLLAHPLSAVYLWFLPLVPLALTAWLIWSPNISYGYWFATSQCVAWALGTASYYALPTLGPGFEYPSLYFDLADTPTSQLMEALAYQRQGVVLGGVADAVQSVAGFASLHCAVTLLVALMVQYTLKNRVLHYIFWVNFGVTVVATIYFGWHYVADDVAGILIALIAFYVGGIASGQKFDRHGLASHPTTTTSSVPVEQH